MLNSEAFVPTQGLDEKAFFFGMNVSDHINAVSHNLIGNTPSFFDRCVYYDGLSENSIRELRDLTEELGMETLKKLNARADALKKRDNEQGGGDQRMNMGMYTWHEKTPAEDPALEVKNANGTQS